MTVAKVRALVAVKVPEPVVVSCRTPPSQIEIFPDTIEFKRTGGTVNVLVENISGNPLCLTITPALSKAFLIKVNAGATSDPTVLNLEPAATISFAVQYDSKTTTLEDETMLFATPTETTEIPIRVCA